MSEDQHITEVSGSGVPLPGDDIDTDQILPARFMKEVTFDNMADYLFYDARRDDDGEFKNFGCGSSREHAPQAMMRWGIDGLIGESFAEIFADNCKSLGIPAATTDYETVSAIQEWIEANPDGDIEIDVVEETVTYGDTTVDVDIDGAMQEALVEGIWDTTQLMYSNMSKVESTVAELPYMDS